MKFVGVRVVGVGCVGLAVVANQIRFGEERPRPASTCPNLEGIHLQNSANCVNLILGVLAVAPLVTQAIDDKLLVALPQRGNIPSKLIVRLHFVDFAPLLGIDLLQQQTSYAQN